MRCSLVAPFVETAECEPGTDEKRLRSVKRPAKGFGDIGDGKAVDVAQGERTAVMGAELAENDGDPVSVEHGVQGSSWSEGSFGGIAGSNKSTDRESPRRQ